MVNIFSQYASDAKVDTLDLIHLLKLSRMYGEIKHTCFVNKNELEDIISRTQIFLKQVKYNKANLTADALHSVNRKTLLTFDSVIHLGLENVYQFSTGIYNHSSKNYERILQCTDTIKQMEIIEEYEDQVDSLFVFPALPLNTLLEVLRSTIKMLKYVNINILIKNIPTIFYNLITSLESEPHTLRLSDFTLITDITGNLAVYKVLQSLGVKSLFECEYRSVLRNKLDIENLITFKELGYTIEKVEKINKQYLPLLIDHIQLFRKYIHTIQTTYNSSGSMAKKIFDDISQSSIDEQLEFCDNYPIIGELINHFLIYCTIYMSSIVVCDELLMYMYKINKAVLLNREDLIS